MPPVIFLRSLVYNIVFYVNLSVLLIGCLPTFFMKRHGIIFMARLWGLSSQWWLRLICGTKLEIRGLEKLPKGGFMVASKHQSTYETFLLVATFRDPAFILKRELQWIPIFGWLTITAEQIPINRKAGAQAVPQMMRLARQAIEAGRQLIVFPEGTRRPVDAPPAYKYGAARIYDEMKVSCVPIALNAGLFWPRRKFLRFPGTIIIEILDPIEPGLGQKEFIARLENVIEPATNRLVAEGRASPEYQAATRG